MNNVIFKQSRLDIRTSFEFDDGRVTHVISDGSGERTFSVPYDAIDLDNRAALSLPSSKPTVYLWAAGFPVGLAALRAGYDQPILGAVLGALSFGLIFFGILAKDRKWFVIRLDLIEVLGAQPLRVLYDGNRDEILARLASSRRQVLRSKYATINLDADPVREKARFDQLLEQTIIDEAEHAAAMRTLGELATASSRPKHALN